MELAGGKAPESMDGRSILPLLVRGLVLIQAAIQAIHVVSLLNIVT